MKEPEETVVFQTGNSVAVRLIGRCRLPRGTRIREYREGNRVILEQVSAWPDSFVAALGSVSVEIPRPPDDPPRNPFR